MISNATNSTTNYGLPKFIATDKPAWLVDWNNTMDELDTVIKSVSDGVTSAGAAITSILSVLGDNESGLVKDVADIKTVLGDATSGLVKNVNDINGEINTIQSDLLTQNGLITSLDQRVTALENA